MLIAFVPVLHKGYIDLFKQYPDELGILGLDVIADYTSLTRDLRVIDPSDLKRAIEALGIFKTVRVLSKADLAEIGAPTTAVVMPDEDVSRDLATKYFSGRVTFASPHIRHRWDKKFITQENIVAPHRVISTAEIDKAFVDLARQEGERSADWWRQIGAVVVQDGLVILKNWNRHLPTDFHLGQNGDPRSNFDRGERPDIYTSVHAEAGIIAQAAKKGLRLTGCSMYVSTFPCSNCARLISEAGIEKVYYQDGYSVLDAEEIFKAYGVEIILVQDSTHPST